MSEAVQQFHFLQQVVLAAAQVLQLAVAGQFLATQRDQLHPVLVDRRNPPWQQRITDPGAATQGDFQTVGNPRFDSA